MKVRTVLLLLSFFAGQAAAQSGLRLPQQGEPGLDPAQARGWLAPDYDHFGFALNNWREAVGFGPGQRMQLTYSLNERSALGWGMGNDLEEQRLYSFYGRYSLTQDWALSAETLGRDATGLFRLQDIRIGVQRRF
ncbi:MAG TPA: hypothetical protein VLF42_05940 [Burkholderiales bacterium]|nr:hypothetical protein [Burkholderiales bacterium]